MVGCWSWFLEMVSREKKAMNRLMQNLCYHCPRYWGYRTVIQYLGKHYTWGGSGPGKGFDCSGLACEVGKTVGFLKRKMRYNAQALKNKFEEYKVEEPYLGCLVFWENEEGKIIHVEICLDEAYSIGASGGGPWVVDLESAIRSNAFVKIRRWDSRLDLWGFVDPFKNLGVNSCKECDRV